MTLSVGGRPWIDLDRIADRIWAWWTAHITGRRGGRHAFDREMDDLAATIAARPWPVIPEPQAEPEADPAWTVEAILRSRQPQLFAPDREYWRDAWADMALFMAAWRADSAQLRAECGLPA